MPRTAVTYTALTPNGRTTDVAGTTIDATLVTNGVVINGVDPERTVLRVTNSATGAKNVIVRTGTGSQSWMAGQGDLTVSVAANTGKEFVGPFTSARFQQQGSRLHVDFESGFTGTITVFKLPKAF
ncbi:hypothetical protein GPZ77_34605 (plasmid) [Streptomyces sp. QHH-9511]|uniref:hypothetical protein n=1 Tax=Streptomyces sp. QHH-9511 TaxID=2684468 RepID=UPI0013186A62|nr:hypothetical protein [Streptomyces sp. QHH-9511]QGZ53363.1 hypothetical protein GPZ77_34605 [Streptomyces sp. QHH-9511]